MNVMIGLSMVLIVSVGYLVMQSGCREGLSSTQIGEIKNSMNNKNYVNVDQDIKIIASHIAELETNVQTVMTNKNTQTLTYEIEFRKLQDQLRSAHQILRTLYEQKQLTIDKIYNKQLNPTQVSNLDSMKNMSLDEYEMRKKWGGKPTNVTNVSDPSGMTGQNQTSR